MNGWAETVMDRRQPVSSPSAVTNECQGIETKYTLLHIPPRLFSVCVTSTRSVAACDYVTHTHSTHKQQYDTREATTLRG